MYIQCYVKTIVCDKNPSATLFVTKFYVIINVPNRAFFNNQV